MKKNIALLITLVFFLIGCGKDEVKPSADSLLTAESFKIIDTIRQAYEGKNEAALRSHLGTALANDIKKQLAFDKAELSFTPRMVRITDKSVRVNLNWRALLSVRGMDLNNRGAADFVFHRETMKLTYIEGDNPFEIPDLRSR